MVISNNHSSYTYKIGGTLEVSEPSYVIREADKELFDKLKKGDFCYVLNSRQMGKSSLGIRVQQKLESETIITAYIDLQDIGRASEDEWYEGIIYILADELSSYLELDWESWLETVESLSPVQRLGQFIEKVLLESISNKTPRIVIFIDEIDYVQNLEFDTDGFFTLIRSCYNSRARKSQYKYITFCLLGVATPSDLIKEKQLTPFNIGSAITLKGFTIDEVEPLIKGLNHLVNEPKKVMEEILYWTGGQPFLTQRLCDLVVNQKQKNPNLTDIVESNIIKNWEFKDQSQHLKTIQDRILKNDRLREKMLRIYERILKNGDVNVDNSYEETQLLLSGLVVKEGNKLEVSNPIYKKVFAEDWVNSHLNTAEKLREELSNLGSELLLRQDHKIQGDQALRMASLVREFEAPKVEKVMLLSQIAFAYLELNKFQKAEENINWALEDLDKYQEFQKIEEEIEAVGNALVNVNAIKLNKFQKAEEKIKLVLDYLDNHPEFQKIEEEIEVVGNGLVNVNAIKLNSIFQKLQTLVHIYYTKGNLSPKLTAPEEPRQAYTKAFRILRETLEKKIDILDKEILPLEIVESIHKSLIDLFHDRQNIDFPVDDVRFSLTKYLEAHYAPITELLEQEKWKEADEKTYLMMTQKIGKEGRQMLIRSDFEKFPSEDLYVVSALWEKYSNGKFGFRKQAEIWLECGGEKDNRSFAPLIAFWQAVGWISEGELPEIELKEINYQLQEDTPDGHLPTTGLRFQEVSLFSRFAEEDALKNSCCCLYKRLLDYYIKTSIKTVRTRVV